jgi:hypothetical protein
MATCLSRIKERLADGAGNLAELATATEDLLQSEHSAWVERMTQTIAATAHCDFGGGAVREPNGYAIHPLTPSMGLEFQGIIVDQLLQLLGTEGVLSRT